MAGTAVDFLGRRPVAMLSDTMSALSVAAIPALVLSFGDRAHHRRTGRIGRRRLVLRPRWDDGSSIDAAGGGDAGRVDVRPHQQHV